MLRQFGGMRRLLPALGLLAAGPSTAMAQDQAVRLQLKASPIEVHGQLLGFDGRAFRLDVPAFGVLRLDASRYSCQGAPCPASSLATPTPPARPADLSTVALDAAAGEAKGERVRVSDRSGIGHDLLPALISGFAATNGSTVRQIVGADPNILQFRVLDRNGRISATFEIARGGDLSVADDFKPGASDAVLLSRQLEPAERGVLRQNLAATKRDYRETVLALDGLIVIAPLERKLARLKAADAVRIFSGQVRDWSELGEPASPIRVYAGSSGDQLTASTLTPRNLTFVATHQRVDSEGDLSDQVANDSDAVGITSLAFERNARAIGLSETCGIESVPSEFAVKSEDYALSRRIYLHAVVGSQTSILARFLAFSLSEPAQRLVRDARLVDQTIGRKLVTDLVATGRKGQAADLTAAERSAEARMLEFAQGAERLSITFRFALASAELDPKAKQDLLRLRAWLSDPAQRGARVLLAGSSDSLGPSDLNLALSRKRAEALRQALGPFAQRTAAIEVDGFGQLNPVACNDTPEGQRVNRRVEVWLLPPLAQSATPAVPRRAPTARR